jgi:hypothetical protein
VPYDTLNKANGVVGGDFNNDGHLDLAVSFSSPEEKNEFLNLVRSNDDMGNDYITELTPPTTEEIRNARPLATVLPHDALTPATLIAVTLCASTEDNRAVS